MTVSFASAAKAEVCKYLPTKRCCALAECFGILLYCNSFQFDGIRIIMLNCVDGNYDNNYDSTATFSERQVEWFEKEALSGVYKMEGYSNDPEILKKLRAEMENKVLSVELIDRKILKPVYEYLQSTAEDFKILVLPDHPTPIEIRTHSMEPVPFFLYDSRKDACGVTTFTEAAAAETGLYIPDGFTLMERVIEKNCLA